MSRKNSLFDAVEEGRFKLVKVLLDHDADVNRQDAEGRTPLMLSVLTTYVDVSGAVDNEKMVKCLLSCGADPTKTDKAGKSALIHAVELGRDISIIKTLLEHGASPSQEDNSGMSSLLYAARLSGPHPDLLKILVSASKAQGKDVIIVTTPFSPTLTKDTDTKDVQTEERTNNMATNSDQREVALGTDNMQNRPGAVGLQCNSSETRGQSNNLTTTPRVLEQQQRHGNNGRNGLELTSSSCGPRPKPSGKKFRGPLRSSLNEEDDEATELCSNPSRKGSPSSIASTPCSSPRTRKGSTQSLHAIEYSSCHQSPLLYNSAKLMKMPPHMRKLIRRNTTDMLPTSNQYPSLESVTDLRQSLESLQQSASKPVNLNQVRKTLVQWERELLGEHMGTSDLTRTGSLPLLDTGKGLVGRKLDSKQQRGSQVLLSKGDRHGSFGSGTKLSDSISLNRPGTLPALGANQGPPLPGIGRAWEPREDTALQTTPSSELAPHTSLTDKQGS